MPPREVLDAVDVSEERFTESDLRICYQTFGDPGDPTLLLVMGLSGPMIWWPDDMCRWLAVEGFHVVRFDNRDAGRSTHFDDHRIDVMATLRAAAKGEPVDPPYTLSDMAADAAALLVELGMAPAHVVGASMGGMIVQTMAIEQPQVVRSVVSIMSTTGDRDVGQPTAEATKLLFAPAPRTEDEAVERALLADQTWGSPAHRDPEGAAARARREWNRARNPAGVGRQLVAINTSGSRTERLREVTVPFTVIHGTADALVTPSGGQRTAEAVPHAVHVEIEGMGHNLPEALWPRILDEIDATVDRTRADDPTRHSD